MNPPHDPNNPNWNNPQQPPPQQPNPGYNQNQNWQQNPHQQQQPPFQQGYNPQQPYQPYIPPYNQMMNSGQMDLPNANNAQICGIVGLVLFWNIIGIILNIVALVMAGNAISEYERMPGRYNQASYNKAKAGRTCGIIGLCLVGFTIVVVILVAVANS